MIVQTESLTPSLFQGSLVIYQVAQRSLVGTGKRAIQRLQKFFVVVAVTRSVLILISGDPGHPESQNTNGILVHLPYARPCETLTPSYFSALRICLAIGRIHSSISCPREQELLC